VGGARGYLGLRRGRPGWRGAGGWTDQISWGMGLWFFLVATPLSFFESVSGPCSVELVRWEYYLDDTDPCVPLTGE
jgi:hypothetical protein